MGNQPHAYGQRVSLALISLTIVAGSTCYSLFTLTVNANQLLTESDRAYTPAQHIL